MNPWENVALWVEHQKAMSAAMDCMEVYANTSDPEAIYLAEQGLQLAEAIIVRMVENEGRI